MMRVTVVFQHEVVTCGTEKEDEKKRQEEAILSGESVVAPETNDNDDEKDIDLDMFADEQPFSGKFSENVVLGPNFGNEELPQDLFTSATPALLLFLLPLFFNQVHNFNRSTFRRERVQKRTTKKLEQRHFNKVPVVPTPLLSAGGFLERLKPIKVPRFFAALAGVAAVKMKTKKSQQSNQMIEDVKVEIDDDDDDGDAEEKIQPCQVLVGDQHISELVERVDLKTFPPKLTSDGSGGVYLLHSSDGEPLAVFKAMEEEPGMSKNPRFLNSPMDLQLAVPPGFSPGQGFIREVLAYELDTSSSGVDSLDSIVPATGVLKMKINGVEKIGSVQKFVVGSDAGDYGSSMFSTEDVQKIGILDIRMLNCDRHASNLMIVENCDLVPIDHGYSLPDSFLVSPLSQSDNNQQHQQIPLPSFEWLFWPQAKKPFTKENLKRIENIDLDHDVKLLQTRGIKTEAIVALWCSTVLLKVCAKAGLTLFEIGSLIQRKGDRSIPSHLEVLFNVSCNAKTGFSHAAFKKKAYHLVALLIAEKESRFLK